MATLITKTETEALLGRSLSSAETTNFDLYMSLAEKRLKGLLCLQAYPQTIDDNMKLLLAQMFGVIVQELGSVANTGVTSKKVEDFSITYESNPDSPEVVFESTYADIIALYSECGLGFRSGRIGDGKCLRCI